MKYTNTQLDIEKPTFRQFLKNYTKDTPVKDLAEDCLSSSSGWKGSSLKSLREHLRNHGVYDYVWLAYKQAVREYMAINKSHL